MTCEREYRNDRQDGKLVFYNPETGRKTSEGTMVYFADTNLKLWHGYYTSWDPYTGHKSEEGNYERGMKVGPWREFHTTGELEGEGSYVNDKRDGPWVHYDKTGKLKANGKYVAGPRQGIWTEEVSWPELGYWKGEYVDRRKMGTWNRYRADGSVADTKTYK